LGEKELKTFFYIIIGLVILAIIIKLLPLGLAIGLTVLLYKKKWLGKKLRITVSILAILFGGILTLAIGSDTSTNTDTTADTTTAPDTTATPDTTTAPAETPAPEPVEPPKPVAPVNVITTLDSTDVDTHIKDQAKADWATDYTEQKYIIGQQTTDYNTLKAIVIDTPEKEQIMNQAHDDWGYDFSETLYIYNDQLKSMNDLNK
jgi:hypothetical protein